jgi:hypothetical protein
MLISSEKVIIKQLMTQANYLLSLTWLFRLWFVYMLGEAAVYLSGLRLIQLDRHWPAGAVHFLHEYQLLWGAASLFMAYLLYQLQKKPESHVVLIKAFTFLSLLLSLILFYMSRIPFSQLLPTPAAQLWLPDYSQILRLEALALLLIGIYLFYGKWRKYY